MANTRYPIGDPSFVRIREEGFFYVDKTEYRFDLSAGDMSRHEELESRINFQLKEWEDVYGKDEREDSFSARFPGLINRSVRQTGLKAVVLADEYDNPLFSTIDDKETHERMRSTLKGIYSVLKAESDNIRFCFLTGITPEKRNIDSRVYEQQ